MENTKPLARAGYLLPAALVIIPIADSALPLLPFRLTDDRWRWGTVGQLSNVMLFPLLGFVIAISLAALSDSQRIKRVIGTICGILAALVSVATIIFVIDYFQVLNLVKPEMHHNMAIASSIATVKNIFTILTLALLSWAGFTGPKFSAIAKQTRKTESRYPTTASPLIGVDGGTSAAPGSGAR